MDREAWHAVVRGVSKSQTWLSDWTTAKTKCTVNILCLNYPEATVPSLPPPHWSLEICLPWNQFLVPKRLGTSDVKVRLKTGVFIELDVISEQRRIGHWRASNTPSVRESWALVNHSSECLLVWPQEENIKNLGWKLLPSEKFNDFKWHRASHSFPSEACVESSPSDGEKVETAAANKTRTSYAGVFANSLYVSKLMKHIYKPLPDVKESSCEFSSCDPYKPLKQFSWWRWVSAYAETECGLSPLEGILPFGYALRLWRASRAF